MDGNPREKHATQEIPPPIEVRASPMTDAIAPRTNEPPGTTPMRDHRVHRDRAAAHFVGRERLDQGVGRAQERERADPIETRPAARAQQLWMMPTGRTPPLTSARATEPDSDFASSAAKYAVAIAPPKPPVSGGRRPPTRARARRCGKR